MKKQFVLLIIGLMAQSLGFSQEYFQQEVNYKIQVNLNDAEHSLSAFIDIEYINNSPDTLHSIFFHLWPNAYKNRETALAKQMLENGNTKMHFADEDDYGFIDSLDFKVNEEHVRWKTVDGNIDVCELVLKKALAPAQKINISTPFYVKIPTGKFSRMGHIGQSYQITQWYPKPAVYDKDGWHAMPYLNQGEFYSEYGSFDVHLTLPENYVVGATGNLMNPMEQNWLHKKAKETAELADFEKQDMDFPESSDKTKTLHFSEKNIHDFAWFADKRYHVLKGEVEIPSGKKITTWTMFTNDQAHLWKKSIEYVNDAVYYYSKWVGDYPYNNCTAVLGSLSAGGGMEYPGITIIGKSQNDFGLDQVITHEVGHNWFYGILGFNERKYPYLDEGINSMYELRYTHMKYPKQKLYEYMGLPKKVAGFLGIENIPHDDLTELAYLLTARANKDQAINLHSEVYTNMNYGAIVYMKAARGFYHLMHYLGEEEFDRIMKGFYQQWKFKHPQPGDLRKYFEKESSKNLSWFFDDFLATRKKVDYKFLKYNDSKVLVKNKGEMATPFQIIGRKSGDQKFMQWNDGFTGKKWIELPSGDFDLLTLDPNKYVTDIDRRNNHIKNKGLFPASRPLKLKFLAGLERSDRSQLFYTPVLGWNSYNKLMPGLYLHNGFFPKKKFEFRLNPMYSVGTNDLAGSGEVKFNVFPGERLQKVSFQARGLQYAVEKPYYGLENGQEVININSISFSANAEYKRKARSSTTHLFEYRFSRVTGFEPIFVDTKEPIPIPDPIMENYHDFEYRINNDKKINPFSLSFNVQSSESFAKAWFTYSGKVNYTSENNGLEYRLFGGLFLKDPDVFSSTIGYFRLSGVNGQEDYLYSHTFLGRSESPFYDKENLWSHQFMLSDGGFNFLTGIRVHDNLLAVNLKSGLPIKRNFVKFFFNAGLSGDLTGKPYRYESGIELTVLPNILMIYFPAFVSSETKEFYNDWDFNYWQRIRFRLNLRKLNLINKVESLY